MADLLRNVFLSEDHTFVDRHICLIHNAMGNEHVELVPGTRTSFTQCLGAEGNFVEKYFVIVFGIISVKEVKNHFLNSFKAKHDKSFFKAWCNFADKSWHILVQTLSHDGKTPSTTPEDRMFAYPEQYAMKMREAYLTGVLSWH